MLLEALRPLWSLENPQISHQQKRRFKSPVTHFWHHFLKFRRAGCTMVTHNKFCGAKHSPSDFFSSQGGPFWLFGLNPGIQNLATLSHLSSAHRPIRATAGEALFIIWFDLSETVPHVEIRPRLTLRYLGLLVKKRRHFHGHRDFWKFLKSS